MENISIIIPIIISIVNFLAMISIFKYQRDDWNKEFNFQRKNYISFQRIEEIKEICIGLPDISFEVDLAIKKFYEEKIVKSVLEKNYLDDYIGFSSLTGKWQKDYLLKDEISTLNKIFYQTISEDLDSDNFLLFLKFKIPKEYKILLYLQIKTIFENEKIIKKLNNIDFFSEFFNSNELYSLYNFYEKYYFPEKSKKAWNKFSIKNITQNISFDVIGNKEK